LLKGGCRGILYFLFSPSFVKEGSGWIYILLIMIFSPAGRRNHFFSLAPMEWRDETRKKGRVMRNYNWFCKKLYLDSSEKKYLNFVNPQFSTR